MPQETIHDMIQRFDQFKNGRKGCALEQSTWHYEDESTGKTRACALGAFFGTWQADSEDYRQRCVGDHAPEWLMEITPTIFDTDYKKIESAGFHIRWAAAIYGSDGIIDRASKLSSVARKEVYAAAERRILECRDLNPDKNVKVRHIVTTDPEKNKVFASTIVTVLDDELVDREV